ncbi:uncharacterized protein LOC122088165 isoform X5 [Macadamia integrifolia]|uniref:uncharacterized protein LOC122088165 isoform X5 n=1 Tax=Macadamia integrifolia TaxID=60698 RepID=UPI001C4FB5EC|nr:uncharacterized protein LOC122088165 isoform X5 [Macadamia integrifolia]
MATGQRASSNPSAMLASLMSKRVKLHEELRNIEKQVYELETSYLQDSNQCGNVLKGFEWFLSASKSTTKFYGLSYLDIHLNWQSPAKTPLGIRALLFYSFMGEMRQAMGFKSFTRETHSKCQGNRK